MQDHKFFVQFTM